MQNSIHQHQSLLLIKRPSALVASPTYKKQPLTGGLNNTTDVGKTWYNSDTDKLMFWDGATAIAVGAGGGGGGDLLADGTVAMTAAFDFGSQKGENLATPTAGTDATNKTYVDGLITGLSTTYVAVAGDAMTGDLTMNAQSDVRLADADSSNYAAIQAPATIGTNYTLTLQLMTVHPIKFCELMAPACFLGRLQVVDQCLTLLTTPLHSLVERLM